MGADSLDSAPLAPAGAGGRFFKEKAPQKPFEKGCIDPHPKYINALAHMPPICRELSKSLTEKPKLLRQK